MSSTNKTPNVELSQFVSGVDKPTWLGDYNSDMLAIDAAIGEIQTAKMNSDEYAPDGTAQVVDGTLTVESEYPHPSDNYAIVFEKPNTNLAGGWSANAVFDGSATKLVPLMVSDARDQSMKEMPDIYFRRGDKAFSLNGANFTIGDITLYVNPATGTPYGEWDNPDKPFDKIDSALATIPRILRNVISVVLAPGYYDNYEYIGGFVGEGGYIDIIGAGTDLSVATSRPTNNASVYSVFRSYIQINRCNCPAQIRGIFFQGSTAVSASRDILAQYGSTFYITQCVFADGPGSKTSAIHMQSWARGQVTNSDFRYRQNGFYLDTGSYLCGSGFTIGAGVTTFATCNRSTANIGLASSNIVVSQSNGGRVFTNYN